MTTYTEKLAEEKLRMGYKPNPNLGSLEHQIKTLTERNQFLEKQRQNYEKRVETLNEELELCYTIIEDKGLGTVQFLNWVREQLAMYRNAIKLKYSVNRRKNIELMAEVEQKARELLG